MKNHVPKVIMLLAVPFLTGNAAEAKKPDDVDVVTVCKADYPEAKNYAEAYSGGFVYRNKSGNNYQ